MPTVKKLELYSYDANPDGSVKIPSLMKRFQEIAREDLLKYGISYNSMRDANQVFVIIKLKIEFKKKISIYDELYLKTIPTKTVGITFYRDFVVYDKFGEIFAVATSTWILMNYETRRIIKPGDIISPIPEFPNEDLNIPLARRFIFSDSPISQKTNVRSVLYSNLDENNHLNNAETASFVIDEISEKIIDGNRITSFEIHFNQESVLGDLLNISTEYYHSQSHVVAKHVNSDASAFECLINFD